MLYPAGRQNGAGASLALASSPWPANHPVTPCRMPHAIAPHADAHADALAMPCPAAPCAQTPASAAHRSGNKVGVADATCQSDKTSCLSRAHAWPIYVVHASLPPPSFHLASPSSPVIPRPAERDTKDSSCAPPIPSTYSYRLPAALLARNARRPRRPLSTLQTSTPTASTGPHSCLRGRRRLCRHLS